MSIAYLVPPSQLIYHGAPPTHDPFVKVKPPVRFGAGAVLLGIEPMQAHRALVHVKLSSLREPRQARAHSATLLAVCQGRYARQSPPRLYLDPQVLLSTRAALALLILAQLKERALLQPAGGQAPAVKRLGKPLDQIDRAKHGRVKLAQKQRPQQIKHQLGARLDKSDTKDRHTVIVSASGAKYRLLNSLDLKNDKSIIATLRGLKPSVLKKVGNQIKVIIGQGAFGKVRLAQNLTTGELVAVKKMSPQDGMVELKKFALLEKLPSGAKKSLVTLKDYALVPGQNAKTKAYLFESLMGEGSLGAKHNRVLLDAPASYANRLKLAVDLIEPVKALHDRGYYHRDLKPENYLKNNQGEVKLGDFGLLTQSSDLSGRADGTPIFMAPEIFVPAAHRQGAVKGNTTDAWALGALLYELAEGAHPLEHFSVTDRQGKRRPVGHNKQLLASDDFRAACDKAKKDNTHGKYSLKSVALHLMHPNPALRLSASQALAIVRELQRVHNQ